MIASNGVVESLFMGMICIDPFSHYFKYIFLLTTFSIILISRYDKKIDMEYFAEYNALLLVVLLGMFLMSSSTNLIMIYLLRKLLMQLWSQQYYQLFPYQ